MLPVIASSSSRHPDFTRSRQRARLSLASDSAFFLVDFLAKLVTLDRDASGALLPEWRKDWPVKSRTLLRSIGHLKYELLPPYTTFADSLCQWIPDRIRSHIEERLGVLPLLSSPTTRVAYAEERQQVLDLLRQQIGKTPAKFEFISFAVIKVHLENLPVRCTATLAPPAATGLQCHPGHRRYQSYKFWDPDGFLVQLNGPEYEGHVG